jgi:hypothetical protein
MGEDSSSAESLLRAGISSYYDNDGATARVCFRMAEHVFAKLGDKWNEQVARDWNQSARHKP